MDSDQAAAGLAEMAEALDDKARQDARVACCCALSAGLSEVGRVLWVGGYIVGPDHVAGDSPFDFGSDATVGLATVAQVGAELLGGVVTLLPLGNRYAALALIRQLVEVEYLAWAFANDEEEAADWLRSSREKRMRRWQPRHLRERSNGQFRGSDYARHCDIGGHPTPESRHALPDHTEGVQAGLCWHEAATHGVSVWRYVADAGDRLGFGPVLQELSVREVVESAVDSWRSADRPRAGSAEAVGK